MPVMKFAPRFVDSVLDGTKSTTIRTSVKRGIFILEAAKEQFAQAELEPIRELCWPDLSESDKRELVAYEGLESIEDLEKILRQIYWYVIDDILSGKRKLYLHRITNVGPVQSAPKLFAD